MFVRIFLFIMSDKNRRGKHFADKEAIALMSLISQLKGILENKKTDGVTNLQKAEAWRKVANAFNASCPENTPRSVDSIKKWWDNKKRIVRKEKGDERKSVLLTGGGPPSGKADPQSDLILSIIDEETVVGGEGPYGSDAQPFPRNISDDEDDYFAYELEQQFVDQPCDNQVGKNDEPRFKTGCSGIQTTTKLQTTTKPIKIDWTKHCMSDLTQAKTSSLKRPLTLNNKKQIAGSSKEELQAKLCITDEYANRDTNLPVTPVGEKRTRVVLNQGENAENVEFATPLPKSKKTVVNRRRPTSTVVRSLAANELAEKYNILVDKKNVIADLTITSLKEQSETNKTTEKLRIQALELDVLIRREQLKQLRESNN